MDETGLNIQHLTDYLQKLGFEEKSSYLSQSCPENTAMFPNQSIGQYLFAEISAVNDKFHSDAANKTLPEFVKEHNASRDNLLKLVVGEDYFPDYMRQLEELKNKRCAEIMENTPHLYHFSQIPPNEFGAYLQPHPQLAGNALSEQINQSLCYAAADKESHYIVKPPSNQREAWDGVSVYMDEKVVMISGYDPKNFLINRRCRTVMKLIKAPLSPMYLWMADSLMNMNLPKMQKLSKLTALFP